MGRTYKVGPSGSFGPRYGTVARKRYSTIVSGLRATHECPQCRISGVKRLSVGVWVCERCGFKFAGGAYAPRTKLGEIAERASRAGVASLLAEIKAQKAREAETGTKLKAPRKRRRAISKKVTQLAVERPPPNDSSSDDKTQEIG